MASFVSTQSGNWSRTSDNADSPWYDGGTITALATVPRDNTDSVTISAGHSVCFDVDHTAWSNGLLGLSIQGHATTPGMLYWKTGSAGTYALRIKGLYNITGTDSSTLGRLLANSDGVWGHTGAYPYDHKAYVLLGASSQIYAQYLSCYMKCVEPTRTYVEVYGSSYGPVAQSSAVDTVNDYIDFGVTLPADDTVVRIRSSGTLPGGLYNDAFYGIYGRTTGSATNSKCKLVFRAGEPDTLVDLTSTGTGDITLYTGWETTDATSWGAGKNTPKVIQDVTADNWASGDDAILCNEAAGQQDIQRVTLTTINADTVVLSAAVNSDQCPLAKLFLGTRNCAIRGGSGNTSILTHGNNYALAGVFGEISNNVSTSGVAIEYGLGAVVSIIWGLTIGVASGNEHTVGAIVGCTTAFQSQSVPSVCYATVIVGCFDALFRACGVSVGTIAGCFNAFNIASSCSAVTIVGCGYGMFESNACSAGTVIGCSESAMSDSACCFAGTIVGCSSGISVCTACSATAIIGCDYGLYQVNGTFSATTFQYNKVDVGDPRGITAYAATLSAPTKVYWYLYSWSYINSQLAGLTIYDYMGTAGYLGRWDCAGYTVSTAYSEETHGTPPITPPTCVHVTIAQDSGVEHWVEFPLFAAKGQVVKVSCYAKQAAASSFITRQTFELIDPNLNSVLATSTQVDDTDWQTHTLVTEAQTADRPLLLRIRCKGGTEYGEGTITAYWFQVIELGYPAAADVRNALSYANAASSGTLIVPGAASGQLTLAKETGANARGGSGTCAKLTPGSTSVYGYWHWYVPATASTPFTLSFYYNATSGFNGTFEVTIYDTDGNAFAAMTDDNVAGTYDGTWRQYTGHSVTPSATGLCLIKIAVKQGAHSGSDVIYIDDIAQA